MLRQQQLSKKIPEPTLPLPSPPIDIPEQVLTFLLPRLTLNQIVQMRLVSHRWNDFIMQFLQTQPVKESSLTVIIQNGDSHSKLSGKSTEEYMKAQFLVDDCNYPLNTSTLAPEIIGRVVNVQFAKVEAFSKLVKITFGKSVQKLIVYFVNLESKVELIICLFAWFLIVILFL